MSDVLKPAIPSIAYNRGYVYLTGPQGAGVAKIGTGRNFTIQGYVYGSNSTLAGGRLVGLSNLILH